MQYFYLILNWSVTIALLGLGLVALLKNHKLTLNRVFALFTVTISIWIIAGYISNDTHNSPNVSVIGNYAVFLFSYISSYLLTWFAITLAGDERVGHHLRKFTLPLVIVGAITCTPLVVAGVKPQGGVYAVEFGPLAVLYFLVLLSLLVVAVVTLHKNIKRTKGDQKAHLVVLYRSMIVALPILLITEFVLPAITGWFGLTNVGIIAMVIPVVGLYYGVVKLKLFNLRLVTVRLLGYVLSIAVLSSIYGFIVFGVAKFIFHVHIPDLAQAIISLGTGLAALGFSRIKSIFDKLSNAVFYSDAYDPQDLFDNLNKILTSSLDMDFLLMHSTKLLAGELKAAFALVGLRGDSAGSYRIFSSVDGARYNQDDIARLQQLVMKNRLNLIITEELGEGDTKLKDVLSAGDIAVVLRLGASLHKEERGAGYLVMGAKKSGSLYNSQDVRVLTTVANELAIAIQNVMQFEEIQHFNLTLQERVNRATAELRRTNQKLEALDETKDDFISMASHQLRTPLTSVKGYLSMVLEGDAGKVSATQTKMLNQAFISSQRMVYLITDLLNVSRLKTGKFVIDATPVDLTKIIAEEVSQLVETAQARGIELTYDKPASLMLLMLDETKIRQVIMNFIDNAIYYTPSGGHIRVEIDDNPTTIELKVVDDGIGVPKSEQHHLFTKFYRAGNARKARPDGTGLGLFMAKKVIVAQGGSIIFSSKENGGSTFGFTFSKEKLKVPDHFKPTVAAATKTKKPAKSPVLV